MNKLIKRIVIGVIVITSCLLLAVGGYVGYMSIQYYRIGDTDLEIMSNQDVQMELDTAYKMITYNVGFGAYTPEYSFFMDEGEMLDGTKVRGKSSVAESRASVIAKTQAMQAIVENGNYDFVALQEVDTNSTRSKKVNMANMLTLPGYGHTFASNFHSPYLLYPFASPHGSVNSGLLSLSRFEVEHAYRKELPITSAFLGKFFDLDRCFSVQALPLANDKLFVFVNIHFTAYDKDGIIRAQQLQVLNQFLTQQKNEGNYVIIAGDYNHDIADSLHLFPTQQKTPTWVSVLKDEDLASGYQIAKAVNAPTCRSADIPYTPGVNYTVVIDGFILSDNIDMVSVVNLDTQFAYSDHNPVELVFKLQG